MRAAGIDASGEIGDGDPLQAIEDALRTFAPDELVISTHPEGRSHWLERDVVSGARERFALPGAPRGRRSRGGRPAAAAASSRRDEPGRAGRASSR